MEYLHENEHIAAAISDIFFNADLGDAVCRDHNGNYIGHAPEKLRLEAESYSSLIKTISGIDVSPDALVKDFFERL